MVPCVGQGSPETEPNRMYRFIREKRFILRNWENVIVGAWQVQNLMGEIGQRPGKKNCS